MDNYPVKRKPSDAAPISDARFRNGNPFISFQFSSKSITFADGKTHIQSKSARYENGKLESQEFEGVADGSVYHNAVDSMQTMMLQQMNSLFRQFSSFYNALPFFSDFPSKRER